MKYNCLSKDLISLLKKLSVLVELVDTPYFNGKEKFAELSELSCLSELKGLEELRCLESLAKCTKEGEKRMGSDLFGGFTPVGKEYQDKKGEKLIAYEEHYMRLLRNYQPEIKEIQEMMAALRQERISFYQVTLPQIEQAIRNDNVLSPEAKETWIRELRSNMEQSFAISESLISHYVTKNLEEFERKLKEEMNKV